ncbi:MAG: hypothetical protein NZ853_05110 [Leptospiraceae bacterium]|nr:hypothetical protein [Leptospiraceae bacterium]MDW7976674.1 hypothetical protein [Leptospiraceae bacterium]
MAKRGSDKMTVVDTLQAAYAKQDLSEERKNFLKAFFDEKKDLTKITKDEVENFFSILREITDKVALINSTFPSDLELSFTRLEEFWRGLSRLDLSQLNGEIRFLFLSHLAFHRESIADIISEARALLIEERRGFLKRLVQYHKEFNNWFKQIEK